MNLLDSESSRLSQGSLIGIGNIGGLKFLAGCVARGFVNVDCVLRLVSETCKSFQAGRDMLQSVWHLPRRETGDIVVTVLRAVVMVDLEHEPMARGRIPKILSDLGLRV